MYGKPTVQGHEQFRSRGKTGGKRIAVEVTRGEAVPGDGALVTLSVRFRSMPHAKRA